MAILRGRKPYSEKNMRFQAKTLVVLGGASGIGEAVVRLAQTYSLSPTDNRIAALFPASAEEEARTKPHYVLILNFFEEIKRRRAQAGAH